jgi:membrane-associated protease RseP (regulator of RpoE activity)
VPEVAGPFATWRLVEVHDQQVFQARLNPGLTVHDPQVRRWLSRWPGRVYAQSGPEGVEVTVSRRTRPRPAERWWLHLLLVLATLVTATMAGAGLTDGDPLRLVDVSLGGLAIPVPTRFTVHSLGPGLWFSLPLMVILGGHEMGHFALARRHGMDVSPPYFIPAPPMVSLIGTFGAFIRLRSPLLNRAVLLDMGAAGPLAGFALSLPVIIAGLMMSKRVTGMPAEITHHIGFVVDNEYLLMGESLGFLALRMLTPLRDAGFVDLHPMAMAGWMGLFFTALNLIPVGQLDGGHVVFSLSRRAHRVTGMVTLAGLLAMGVLWPGWLVWGALILLVGRGRIAHPPVFDPDFRLNGPRRVIAWACIVIFVLTFIPQPFQF